MAVRAEKIVGSNGLCHSGWYFMLAQINPEVCECQEFDIVASGGPHSGLANLIAEEDEVA